MESISQKGQARSHMRKDHYTIAADSSFRKGRSKLAQPFSAGFELLDFSRFNRPYGTLDAHADIAQH
jgi:hypothetical protein